MYNSWHFEALRNVIKDFGSPKEPWKGYKELARKRIFFFFL